MKPKFYQIFIIINLYCKSNQLLVYKTFKSYLLKTLRCKYESGGDLRQINKTEQEYFRDCWYFGTINKCIQKSDWLIYIPVVFALMRPTSDKECGLTFPHHNEERIIKILKSSSKVLKKSLKWTCCLDLNGQRIGLYGVMSFSVINSLQFTTLLNLRDNNIGNEAVRLLAMREWKVLEILDLSDNLVSSAGIKHFTRNRWPNLKVLQLSYNPIGNVALATLSKLKSKNKLLELGMQNCKINEIGMLLNFKMPKLRKLNLNGNSNIMRSSLNLLMCEKTVVFPCLQTFLTETIHLRMQQGGRYY